MSRSRLKVYIVSHVASGLIRRHVFENLAARPQDTGSHGTQHFVSGKGKEIATEFLHIDGEMRNGLRTVHQDERRDAVGSFAYLFCRIDQADDVRYVGKRNKLGALG